MTTGTKADRRAPSWVVWVLAALVVALLIGGVVSVAALGTILRQNAALKGGCVRLQIQRDRINVSEARQFVILTKANPRFYRPELETILWNPPADCDLAIKDPGHYRQPPVVPFVDLPPEFPQEILDAAREGRPSPTP